MISYVISIMISYMISYNCMISYNRCNLGNVATVETEV